MPHFEDLSDYIYHNSMFWAPGTKNIGWLSSEHGFLRSEPSEVFLDKIWSFCKISVAQMRGIHECDLCSGGRTYYVKRGGEPLLLGSSEIRVFSDHGDIYAAPTLIYHYIATHHYSPPDEFLRAVDQGPCPPDHAYFDRLSSAGLAWNDTSAPSELPERFKYVREGDQFVKKLV